MQLNKGLLTDFYELSMIQGYFKVNKNPLVVFDMFFRSQPFNSGYSIFAGLGSLLKTLENFTFSKEDIDYLNSLGCFDQEFLDYLKNFKFEGDIYAMEEGTVVFPNEPLIRVHAKLIEAQILESIILNIINFQTLIATKAARIYLASEKKSILEFGLRRSQGIDGALSASRAAYIGGVAGTSNTMAGKKYGIPVSGTMAHSWVMAFENEEEAFFKFAEIYPNDAPILLIDTYDTLGSGIENAIKVGKALKKQGRKIGVRLDSGDLQYLSDKVRKRLDKAGLDDAFIVVSNELNEEVINQLARLETPIDNWGVGTNLVTGGKTSALTGVYKLVSKKENDQYKHVIKLSNNPAKTTMPGIKQVYRFYDHSDSAIADMLTLNEEKVDKNQFNLYHPHYDKKFYTIKEYKKLVPLLKKVVKNGKVTHPMPSISVIQSKTKKELECLDSSYKRLLNPHIYKISLSAKLKNLKDKLTEEKIGFSEKKDK